MCQQGNWKQLLPFFPCPFICLTNSTLLAVSLLFSVHTLLGGFGGRIMWFNRSHSILLHCQLLKFIGKKHLIRMMLHKDIRKSKPLERDCLHGGLRKLTPCLWSIKQQGPLEDSSSFSKGFLQLRGQVQMAHFPYTIKCCQLCVHTHTRTHKICRETSLSSVLDQSITQIHTLNNLLLPPPQIQNFSHTV